jgi:hypothetical protein
LGPAGFIFAQTPICSIGKKAKKMARQVELYITGINLTLILTEMNHNQITVHLLDNYEKP